MPVTPLSRIFDLGLSTRATNSLMTDNIIYVGDLVQKTVGELRQFPDMGVATVGEIEATLAPHGLRLGQPAPNWPPANIEAALAAAA